MNFSVGEIDDVFQITVVFVIVYNNKAVFCLYTNKKGQPIFNKLMWQEIFQLPLHAANVNSQRSVFTINMPLSFLLWWIVIVINYKL